MNSQIKRIDNLGRIVVPKDIRKKLNLDVNDEIEIILNFDKTITLKPFSTISEYEEDCKVLLNTLNTTVKEKQKVYFAITDASKITVFMPKGDNEEKQISKILQNSKLKKEVLNIIIDRKIYINDKKDKINLIEEGTTTMSDKNQTLYLNALFPIISNSTLCGSIIMFSCDNTYIPKDETVMLLKFCSEYLSHKIKG